MMAAASTPLLLKIQKGLFVSLCLDVSEASSRGERRIASFTTACSRILSIGKGSKRRQEQEQARERERERERTVLDRKGKKKQQRLGLRQSSGTLRLASIRFFFFILSFQKASTMLQALGQVSRRAARKVRLRALE